MAIEAHCDGAVLDDRPREKRGVCDHCDAITTNWYRSYDGTTGFECVKCLELEQETAWGDIHA